MPKPMPAVAAVTNATLPSNRRHRGADEEDGDAIAAVPFFDARSANAARVAVCAAADAAAFCRYALIAPLD